LPLQLIGGWSSPHPVNWNKPIIINPTKMDIPVIFNLSFIHLPLVMVYTFLGETLISNQTVVTTAT
jgi:hypothetical protein